MGHESRPGPYPLGYTCSVRLLTTDAYDRWFRRLRDHQARARILATLRR